MSSNPPRRGASTETPPTRALSARSSVYIPSGGGTDGSADGCGATSPVGVVPEKAGVEEAGVGLVDNGAPVEDNADANSVASVLRTSTTSRKVSMLSRTPSTSRASFKSRCTPLVIWRNWAIALPICRPAVGRRSGPRKRRATTRISRISCPPTFSTGRAYRAAAVAPSRQATPRFYCSSKLDCSESNQPGEESSSRNDSTSRSLNGSDVSAGLIEGWSNSSRRTPALSSSSITSGTAVRLTRSPQVGQLNR